MVRITDDKEIKETVLAGLQRNKEVKDTVLSKDR